MPIPGEQPDLAALPPDTTPVKRRLAAQYVREARDRLTSSSGTRPAFDHELLRQYAQNRISASLIIMLLGATVGLMSSLWTGVFAAGTWTAAVLVIHAVMTTKCRRFLEHPMHEVSPSVWWVRFVLARATAIMGGRTGHTSDLSQPAIKFTATFGQGSNSIKSAERGAGLGLPIAKSLVDLHGGPFTLKSRLGIGTEVTVTFPPSQVVAAMAPIAEQAPSIAPEGKLDPSSDETRRLNSRPLFRAGT
jgi:hypothetical protein